MSYYLMQAMCAFVIALHLQVKDSDLENQHSWDRQEHQEPIAMMATTSRILTLFMYEQHYRYSYHTAATYCIYQCIGTD